MYVIVCIVRTHDMYVFMYVRTYVCDCMYYVRTHDMYVCVCMYVLMYVRMYVFVRTHDICMCCGAPCCRRLQ